MKTVQKYIGLTSENATSLIGKTIKWKSPSYRGNEGYGGTFHINEVTFSGQINGHVLNGDDLKHAYLEGNDYAYSDDDRFVTFVELD